MSNHYKNIFEEAYNAESKEFILINKIIESIKKDTKYKDNIRGKLFCPHCKLAELTFVNGKFKYLRTSLNSNHDIKCEFNYPVITEKHLYNYINKEYNQSKVYNYLKMIVSTFYYNSDEPLKQLSDDYNESLNKKMIQHRFLRRNFNNGLSRDDERTLKLYYGQAFLCVKGDSSWSERYLQIISPVSKKAILSLKLKQDLFNDFKETISLTENRLYDLAFFGQIYRNEKGFLNAKIDSITQIFAQETISS